MRCLADCLNLHGRLITAIRYTSVHYWELACADIGGNSLAGGNFKEERKVMNGKLLGILALCVTTLAGCVSSGGERKIIVDSYTTPREYQKIQGLLERTQNASASEALLSIGIDPEVRGKSRKKGSKLLRKALVTQLKTYLTQTNFISIYPLFEEAPVKLTISILDYQYHRKKNELSASLDVSYSLSMGAIEYYTKSYAEQVERYAKSAQGLPGVNEVVQEMSEQTAKRFVQDLSPVKTKQLRELKPFPSGLEHLTEFMRSRNYDAAIAAMEGFPGQRDAEYFYNLAVIYEAAAAQREDIDLLQNASDYYASSMALGGSGDKIIAASFARFDKYYRLFSDVLKQRRANQQYNQKLNRSLGL